MDLPGLWRIVCEDSIVVRFERDVVRLNVICVRLFTLQVVSRSGQVM